MKARDEVRTHHDEWTKRALSLWLKDLGEVTLDARIAGQSRRGDVLYTERRDHPALRRRLGVLGDLARGEVLFEPFRNPPTPLELKGCVLKAIDLEAQEARAARRNKRKLSSVVGPALCVITPSMSADYAELMGIKPMARDKPGLHVLLGSGWHTVIVVTNELPPDRATLWLRLLGRGAVQGRAVQELAALSEQEPLRDATLALLIAWRQSLPPYPEQSEDERELTMNLDQIYERWEQKTLARGHREAKAEDVLTVLAARGLAVTPAQRKQVLACANTATLDRWLIAAVTVPSVKALLSDSAPSRPREKRA